MSRSLKRIALVVTLGTLLSKAGGMARQLVIAGAFGVGAAYDAYSYAYVLPGFFLILLGGINGPFHNAMVSVLSRRTKQEGAYVLAAINTLVSGVLIIVTGFLVLAANPLINILGPGLSPEIHKIAVLQLQIMAPIALFAGLIGLGFGSLNANDEFFVPAISPLTSSLVLIVGVSTFWLINGPANGSLNLEAKGGILLAVATLTGALLQWLLQLPALIQKGLAKMRLVWDLNHQGVKEVLQIIAPATLSSGMLQINVFTDLFFASNIVGAAAGLSYATFIVQAPLGLISNALLIPLLPTFSKLTGPQNQNELLKRIRQGIMLSSASMIPLGAIFIILANSIVSLVYERGAFDSKAVNLVAGLLMAYGIGMPAYLGRDVLVRVFYALGDGKTPFRLSIAGIALNGLFDWILIGGPTPWGNQSPFNFGAPGLVLATVGVNLLTSTALLFSLHKRLGGLPLRDWAKDSLKLFFSGTVAGLIGWSLKSILIWHWPISFWGLLMQTITCTAACILTFGLIGSWLKVQEIDDLIIILRTKIGRL